MIRLDLDNNEVVFSGMSSVTEISNALGSVKDLKQRRYNDRIYVPISDMDKMQMALRDYRGKFEVTERYKQLMTFLKPAPIVIDWTPSYCYIKGGRLPFHDIIPATSYFDKKFKHVQAYKRGRLSGMVHLFNVALGRFPSGLLEIIVEILNKNNLPFELNRKFDYPEPYLTLQAKFPFEPSKDQVDSVSALHQAKTGIGKLPTGFGKTSYVSVALIEKMGVKTMFLANQRILINDAKDDFQEAFEGEEIGVIGDGEYNPQNITVASIQGVIAALNPPTKKEMEAAEKELRMHELRFSYEDSPNNKGNVTRARNKIKQMQERIDKQDDIIEYLKTVDMFIIDEGQVIGTSMWNKFFDVCPAPYRYTLTATDTRTDGGKIEIVAATGPRRYVSTASEQIEKDRLSEFLAHYKLFDHNIPKAVLKDMKLDYNLAYETFIVNNDARNNYLCDWIMKWKNEGHFILALVTRVEHGMIVKEILENRGLVEGKDYEYVDGSTKKATRQDIIARFRNEEFQILIGTSIFDVGFNAKNASKMVRFNAGSSEVREVQRAGRTVRKRDDGVIGEMIDVIDLNVPYFQSQGWKRKKLLETEFGMERVNLLNGKIDSETPIALLKDVANQIPEPMDKATLMHAIEKYVEVSNAPEVKLDERQQQTIDGALSEIFGDDLDLFGGMFHKEK